MGVMKKIATEIMLGNPTIQISKQETGDTPTHQNFQAGNRQMSNVLNGINPNDRTVHLATTINGFTSGLAKNIGHDAVEAFTKDHPGKLSKQEIQALHQAIRQAVDEHTQPIQNVLNGINPIARPVSSEEMEEARKGYRESGDRADRITRDQR